MPHTIFTYTNIGLEGHQITVEVDSNRSLPTIEIIGLPDAAIKESKERIRASFRNTGVDLPPQKIILNLAPSNIRKVGTRFDLPLAVAILRLIEAPSLELGKLIQKSLFFGELGLDGSVKKTQGILPSIISAYQQGWRHFFISHENAPELEYLPDIHVYQLHSFKDMVGVFSGNLAVGDLEIEKKKLSVKFDSSVEIDFKDIKGHLISKRALTLAAAGMHNVLMTGPPGSGKTMLAKACNGILPPLVFDQIIEVSQMYSIIGALGKHQPLVISRPFRSVHHTASRISIVGGGQHLKPGEISLAHHGILFFDELAEFPRDTLEVLRQPLEDKKITISRASGSVQYPANFMFVAAMNPCKCGFYKDREKPCTCSLNEIKKYQSKISGPMLDRFDLILEIPRENIDTILEQENELSSADLKTQVIKAWKIQSERYKTLPFSSNAHIGVKEIQTYIKLEPEAEVFLKDVVKRLALSPRVAHRAIKLGRTIADLQDEKIILRTHIAEALQYREKHMFV